MSKRKLLLADDSVTIQKVVNLTFADEGIDVETVGDGDTAMERIAQDRPDIVLADVNMPGLSGYQICERLRSDEATRNVPVILLVGSFEPFDEGEAARVGANAYLTKPFQSIRQLVAQVTELINSTPVSNGDEQTNAPETAPESEPPTSATVPDQAQITETDEADFGHEQAAAPVAAAEEHSEESTQPQDFDDLGYRSVEETPEPAAGPADDIESLYSQSFSPERPGEIGDIGLDDEMIETSYTAPNDNSDLLGYQTASSGGEPADFGEASHEFATTGQFDPAVAQSAIDSDQTAPSEYESQSEERPSAFESTIAYDDWRPADMRDDRPAEAAAPPTSEQPAVDAEPRSHETVSPIGSAHPIPEQSANVHSEAAPSYDQPEPGEHSASAIGEDTVRMDTRFDAAASSTYNFDEADLLDLAPGGVAPVEITSPAHAAEQGGTKQLVTLSPELIEMIAQRVVEKLSERY